ncbi:serine carboxypeptidase [Aureococcus anophagefferens]|nr:serine carboxypeptidase [Aureococcus anophagefferens]
MSDDAGRWEPPGAEFPPGHKALERYLNVRAVRRAIHVTHSAAFLECTDPPYDALSSRDGVGVSAELAAVLDDPRRTVRVLFFNGVRDLVCNHLRTETVLEKLAWAGATSYARSGKQVWYVGSSAAPAGYVKNAYGQLTYLAVLDSGHMVPMDAPARALDMIDRFVRGASLGDASQSISTTAGGADPGCAPAPRPTPRPSGRLTPGPTPLTAAPRLRARRPSPRAAYVAPAVSKPATALNGKQEMVELAEANPDFLGSTIGFWDPFNLIAEGDFWGLGNEATIGYLRHAEIKHGRPYSGYVSNVSPQEQWENVPAIGKLQILVLVGMLESYGEGAGSPEGYVHYCSGGLPGYFPPISGKAGFGQVGFNLYDPFNWFPETSPEQKARGRQVEINNGRLAMLGMFSLLSESAAPGALPLSPLDDYTLKFISSFPSAGTGGLGAAWSQFDIFSSLPTGTRRRVYDPATPREERREARRRAPRRL